MVDPGKALTVELQIANNYMYCRQLYVNGQLTRAKLLAVELKLYNCIAENYYMNGHFKQLNSN